MSLPNFSLLFHSLFHSFLQVHKPIETCRHPCQVLQVKIKTRYHGKKLPLIPKSDQLAQLRLENEFLRPQVRFLHHTYEIAKKLLKARRLNTNGIVANARTGKRSSQEVGVVLDVQKKSRRRTFLKSNRIIGNVIPASLSRGKRLEKGTSASLRRSMNFNFWWEEKSLWRSQILQSHSKT